MEKVRDAKKYINLPQKNLASEVNKET